MVIIKGTHAILEAIKSPIKVLEIMVTKDHSHETQHIITLAKQQNIPVQTIDKRDAQKHYKCDAHQHVLAKIQDIPTIPLKTLDPSSHPLIMALDHLEDPFNVGAIMRTCEAFGISTIILPKDRQAPLSSGVIKASSGGIYYLNIVQVSNIAQALGELEKKGYWLYATSSHFGTPLPQFEPAGPCVLVMGNEHKGISKRVQKLIHDCIKIPMNGTMESLNVSVAAGVVGYAMAEKLNITS